jgi:hypothetical protein
MEIDELGIFVTVTARASVRQSEFVTDRDALVVIVHLTEHLI